MGCGDSLSPTDVLGTYTLLTIMEQVPPRIILDEPGCQYTVTGGSLVLEADRRFQLQLDEVTACPNPTGPGEVAELWLGQYHLDGATVVLRAVGDVFVDYRARLRDGRLVVSLGGPYGDVVFERARS